MKTARAFTLVEVLIVVVILGILAATVITFASGSTLSAKESAVATDLQLLRNYILIYRCQHLEVAPGYPGGDTTATPTQQAFIDQATLASNSAGQTAAVGTAGFVRGPYMQLLPVNPLNNGNRSVKVVTGTVFPAADGTTDWVYLPELAQIKVNTTGNDSIGKPYYDY
jgi:general secretion pathway protein G